MPSNKEHHYVPQFYLRNFSANGKAVRAFNIARRLHVPAASIRGQCRRSYLYGGSESKLEGALADLEGVASTAIRGIVQCGSLPTDQRERLALGTFALAQWGRTPTAARLHNLWITKMYRNIARTVPDLADRFGPRLGELCVEQPDAILDTTVESVRYAPAILDLRVKVVRNASTIEFVTSDAPVAFHNQWAQEVRGVGTIGYACSGLQIFLPLDPVHLLVFYDPRVYRIGSERASFVTTADLRFVRQMNALQAMHAEENVYYRSAASAESVDALPWHLRSDPESAVDSDRFAEEGGTSTLIATFRPMTGVKLSSLVIKVHRKMDAVPVLDRGHRWRPLSCAIIDHIHAERFPEVMRDEQRGAGAAGRSFRRIES